MFGVMLISAIPCLFVLLRVDKQATEVPGVQQVEVTEQELIEAPFATRSVAAALARAVQEVAAGGSRSVVWLENVTSGHGDWIYPTKMIAYKH